MARTNGHTRWQNRIVGEDMVDADQLLANPTNWRIHPKHQQEALAGVLDNVGWVQRVIVNQRSGHVIDGHLRASLAISRGEQVPVIYVDVDEDEERLILATLDPLAGMAFHKLHDQSWSALPSLPPPDYDNDNAHSHPTLGRYIYAVGNREAAAYLSGVNTRLVLIAVPVRTGLRASHGAVRALMLSLSAAKWTRSTIPPVSVFCRCPVTG